VGKGDADGGGGPKEQVFHRPQTHKTLTTKGMKVVTTLEKGESKFTTRCSGTGLRRGGGVNGGELGKQLHTKENFERGTHKGGGVGSELSRGGHEAMLSQDDGWQSLKGRQGVVEKTCWN